METGELKKGMRFILNNGRQVEYTGNEIFRDVKTGKKHLADNLIGQIKYGYKSNEELVLNEEPLGLPVVNFDEDEETVTANVDNDNSPLGVPALEFEDNTI